MTPTETKPIIEEMAASYGFDASDVRFDERGEAVFSYETLQMIAHALCRKIIKDELYPVSQSGENGYATACARLFLADGRCVERTQIAFFNEPLDDGKQIESLPQANNVAMARAYRAVLRAISFHPIKAYLAHKAGKELELTDEERSLDTDRKALHAAATDLGLIVGRDKSAYEEFLATFYNGRITSLDLTDEEVGQAASFLRARLNARQRTTAATA